MTCQHCGAPIVLAQGGPTICPYCKRENAPPPKEVMVPVPVQVIQNVVQVTADAASVRELRCPHCRKHLVTAAVKGVELSGCSGCGGIWIDNASARKVLAAPERVYGELAERAAANAHERSAPRAQHPICAECPATLDRTSAQGIELDVCPEHGTWFDARELRQLMDALRGEHTAPARGPSIPPSVPTVRCTGCNTTLRADRANVTDMGLRCDACWRIEQADLVRIAEQNYQQTSGSVAAGVLVGVAAVLIGATASSRS